jgi:hypothetical protein
MGSIDGQMEIHMMDHFVKTNERGWELIFGLIMEFIGENGIKIE